MENVAVVFVMGKKGISAFILISAAYFLYLCQSVNEQ